MNRNFNALISTLGLVVACGGTNTEAQSADNYDAAPAPEVTPESTPIESTPSPSDASPSDASPIEGATPGDASPEAPTPPTSLRSSEGELLSARTSFGTPAPQGANAGSGGKTGSTGTTGGSSSSTGGTSSKGG